MSEFKPDKRLFGRYFMRCYKGTDKPCEIDFIAGSNARQTSYTLESYRFFADGRYDNRECWTPSCGKAYIHNDVMVNWCEISHERFVEILRSSKR